MKSNIIKFLFLLNTLAYGHSTELLNLKWYDSKDKVHKLSEKDFSKKITVLKFFKSNCPGCLSFGLPLAKKVSDHYKSDTKVQVLIAQTVFSGFRTNTKSKLKDIRKRFNLDVLMAQDDLGGKGSSLIGKYRAQGTPWFVILDENGKVLLSDYRVSFKGLKNLIDSAKNKIIIEVSQRKLQTRRAYKKYEILRS